MWEEKRLFYPLEAMMEAMASRHAGLATRSVDFGHFAKKVQCPYEESRKEIYVDIVEDLARFFIHGLEPGGLALQILQNDTWERMRRNCHQLVSDEALLSTVAAIHELLSTSRDGDTMTLIMVKPT